MTEMISCIYYKDKKCIHERYFSALVKRMVSNNRYCLFINQDKCPLSD